MLQDLRIEWQTLYVTMPADQVSRNIELKPGHLLKTTEGKVILIGHAAPGLATCSCCEVLDDITAVSESLRKVLLNEGVIRE